MPTVPTTVLASLQSNPNNVRNICIIAHVDHGKTSLSDSLISSNGIISQKLAGKIKYLDNRPDEQDRQITMKSSCISLMFHHGRLSQDYLVNLIDSPGHVDFSSEVSTAVRLSDGALVLVDVLEGVCIQTTAVLRQAWTEKVKPCLVINKLDRLFELNLTPEEAFHRIRVVLEQVNAVTGTLFSEDWLKSVNEGKVSLKGEDAAVVEGELDEEEVFFSPDKGNVVFACAIDGWGFRIDHFCKLYAQKLGVKEEILRKTLWGEYYFDSKTKKIYKKNVTGKMTPMFVQFVLNNIWHVYNAAKENDNTEIEKIVGSLKLTIPPRELKYTDPRVIVQAIFSRWLPVADAILEMVVDKLPSPKEAQAIRIHKLWQPSSVMPAESVSKIKELKESMEACDPNGEVVAFVSKVVAVSPDSILPITRQPPPRRVPGQAIPVPHKYDEEVPIDKDKERFVGFARIFSGTIRRGQVIHVMGPRYNPLDPNKYHTTMQVKELFLLMGRNLEYVDSVPAGNVFGIGEVGDVITKSATISTTPICSVFNSMMFVSSPIVRVALEPEIPTEMPKLLEGLKLLNHADPSVKVLVQETGEHVIVTSGELHLERCLTDLRERFAKIKIRVSPPLVSFRETITSEPSLKYPTNPPGVKTANKLGHVKVTAVPLPENIKEILQQNDAIIKRIFVDKSVSLEGESDAAAFREQLREAFKKAGWEKELDHLWAFGPRRIGANILLNYIPGYWDSDRWKPIIKEMFEDSKSKAPLAETERKLKGLRLADHKVREVKSGTEDEDDTSSVELEKMTVVTEEDKLRLLVELDNSIVNGFQIASNSGPLCAEPMCGVCFVVQDVILKEGDDNNNKIDSRGPFSGQIMSAMKGACWEAFLSKSVRLMEAMYTCDIQIGSDFLGRMYAVLGRRRSKILKEEMKEGTYIYSIQALLPVVESFGLSEEILTQTSGAASIQLVFSHWEVLDKDPYFIAHTEEELEDIGENLGGVAPNIARQYIDAVRKRKGLPVEEQIVKFANKQRNLSKKK